MTESAVAEVLTQLRGDVAAGAVQFHPIAPSLFDRIESVFLSAPIGTFLRAADALHLACAAENGFAEIHSNDRHLLAAAPLFGLRGMNAIPG
jgi:predicted nucleic acid-binding protein